MLNSLSHEVVHYIKEMSPDKFRKLADFVVGKFGEKGVSVTRLIRAKQSKYAAQGQELSFMDAYEEVVADSVESMLSQKTEKIISDIAEMRKVDADLAKTFVDKVKDLVGKMLNVFKKNKFQANPETEEGKFFAKWSEFGDGLSGIFAEAAADAADKAAQAARRTDSVPKNKKPADDAADGVFENSQPMKNMLRSGFEADMDDFNLRRTPFGRQLADWRSNQGNAGGSYNGHYFELGKTPQSLIKHGAPDVSLIMYDDCLVKITGGKHDTALDEIAKIPQELSDPILLFKGSVPNSFVAVTEIQTKQGNEAIVAVHINKRHGRNVINKIASLHSRTTDYGKNYIVEYVKNQIHAGNLVDASAKKAPTWFTTRGLQLPKVVQTIIDANNSISNPAEKINPSGKKSSQRTLTKENTPANTEVKNMKRNVVSNIVDLSEDKRLAQMAGGRHGSVRYNIIRDYILDELKDQPIRMSDGKMAIVDRGDAQHIASRGRYDDKVAQISHIQKIIENAKLVAEENSTKDRKFDYYWYYETQVRYRDDILPVYVNLGRARNGEGYHIYDLTNKLRDTAHRVNDVGRPVGNALKSGISINSISNPVEKINPSDEKNSRRNLNERQIIVDMLKSLPYEVEHNQYFQEYLDKIESLDSKQAKEGLA